MTSRSLLFGLLAPLSFLPSVVMAEASAAAQPLYVIRPIVHAEREHAELCLEFDHDLAAVGSVSRIAAAFHLEVDGRNSPVAARNISLGGNQMCVSGLEHRKNYRLVLGALRDNKGEKLSRTYSFSFTMPARRPSLSIVHQEVQNGINIWRDNPVLNSVNGQKVTLELYRITDPSHMAEAWMNRLQTTLAPSESIYFAKHNGALVWKKDVTPEAIADKNIMTKIDFDGLDKTDLASGLYLLAATQDEVANEKNSQDKNELKKADAFIPTAAAWLLRSGLRVQALGNSSSLTVLTENTDALSVAKDVRVMLMDREQKIIAETKSDNDGRAVLNPKSGQEAVVLAALDDKANPAFFDVAGDKVLNPVLSPLVANLSLDQSVYAPRDTVNVTLAAHDLHKRPQNLKGSTLQLLRPDHTYYENQPVNLDAGGGAKLTLTAPATNGVWHLVWRQEDGQQLAATDIRISQNAAAPQLSVAADRPVLLADGHVQLMVRSRSLGNAPVPYVAGHVELAWQKADHLFSSWKDYIFDDGKPVDATAQIIAPFVTDKNGTADIHVTLPASQKASFLRQARLWVVGDAARDVLGSEPVILPVKPAALAVGINPRANNNVFPENSLAHFDVVVLDAEGNRQPADDLTYQFFEQGRSFEWFQSDGSWNYKPQQQRRRIGGGNISVGDDGMAAIEWPVTSGAYQLEIANAEGVLLAHIDFNAGWSAADKDTNDVDHLSIKATPANLQSGTSQKITFALSQPSLVTVSVADDHIRHVAHGVYPAGVAALTLPIAADWGNRLLVRVNAHSVSDKNGSYDATGTIVLAADHDAVSVPVSISKVQKISAVAKTINPDRILSQGISKTIAPNETSAVPSSNAHVPGASGIVFVSPLSLDGFADLLSTSVQRQAFTTQDIATKWNVEHQWRDVIVASGLLQDNEWQAFDRDTMTRLLQRQNDDGGFLSMPYDGDSDMASTSAAVEVLAKSDDPLARPALDQAVRWLNHRLENTWFVETERPVRAAAYAALATAKKLDLASLHYFSDTSANKQIPSLAAAQLAYAFASIADKAAANYWLDKIKTDTSPDLLPVLLENDFYLGGEFDVALNVLSQKARQSGAWDDLGRYLSAYSHAVNKFGAWHMAQGKEDRVLHGVSVVLMGEKAAIRNSSSDHALYMMTTSVAKAAVEAIETKHHVYNLDGSEVVGTLKRGSTYVIMAEGMWRKEQQALVVHDVPHIAITPITCAVEASNANGFLSWLSETQPMAARACEKNANGIDALLMRDDRDSNTWRVAYLAKSNGVDTKSFRPATVQNYVVANPDDKDAQH